MDNKLAFDTAHSRTRTIVAKNPTLKYRIVFSFQLKKAIAEQHKKVALVGDYKKPTIKNDNIKLPFFMLSSMLIIFAIALQAINLL